MKRVFHPYHLWEDFKCGMWRNVVGDERNLWLQKAVEFTGDAELYGLWMMKVIKAWPISCEQNLTCTSMNRQAWIGHAACCLAIGCPEDITRAAWHLLTDQQRNEANQKADEAIKAWELGYIFGDQLCLKFG